MKGKETKKVFIIAEAGVNHNGDIETAYKLIKTASQIGADAIKFQTFIPEKNVSCYAKMAKYQIQNIGKKTTQLEMIKKLSIPIKSWKEIKNFCDREKIIFLSTPYDYESIDILYNLVPLYKIPSGEINNFPYLKYIASKKKPLILSTGMSFLSEIKTAIEIINSEWKNADISILHCTSNYPAPYSEINLNAIHTLKNAFRYPIGYSDHSEGIIIPIAAVALGATIIEKHFTLNKNDEGPDHKASLDPNEFFSMINAIRDIEFALGSFEKKPTRSELKTKLLVRRSLVAARDIKAREVITKEDIEIKRPGTGLEPGLINSIIGKKILHPIKKDQLYTKKHFK